MQQVYMYQTGSNNFFNNTKIINYTNGHKCMDTCISHLLNAISIELSTDNALDICWLSGKKFTEFKGT